MTDSKILQQKLNLEDSVLDEKEKEQFLDKTNDFHDVFSLQDEIGYIEVHFRLKEDYSERNRYIRMLRYNSKRVDQL